MKISANSNSKRHAACHDIVTGSSKEEKLDQSGGQVEEIPREWRCLKSRVSNDLHGKSYLDLYQTLLLKQPYRDEMQNILHFVQILLVLPISSANCASAFNVQKRIKLDVRSSLTSLHLSDLNLISTEGSELQQYDPSSAVERWLKSSGKRKPFAKKCICIKSICNH